MDRPTIQREDREVLLERFRRIYKDKVLTDLKVNGREEFQIPGFSISDFNRAGKLGIWNILKGLEVTRGREFNEDQDGSNVMTVIVSQRIEINPELYKRAALVRPMRVICRQGHAGTMSSSIFIELHDSETGALYLRNQRQFCSIDVMKRKRVPIQGPFAGLGHFDPTAMPITVPDWKPSPNAMTYTFKILHSDADHLYHTNQAIYLKLCINAAANACNGGKLNNFSGDFLRYDVSSALMRYLGETFPGDDVDVTLWEDKNDLDTLYFHISRSKKLILTAKFIFYKFASSKL